LLFEAVGLNITIDIIGDINGDKNMQPFKHWMKHTAIVPKGFIRYQVLESLSEKPMSGSEIMTEIEKKTSGRWKPSPGSIYPLLSWLQDNSYIEEVSTKEGGMKRYTLTKKGKTLFEEQKEIRMKFRKEAKFMPSPFLGGLWFHIPPEKTVEVRDSMFRVFSAFFELGSSLEKKFSDQTIEDVQKILNETAEKLEELNKKIKVKKDE
jgi:DNA-binding PadR family transcriptional regulator